ncbi:MAG: glycogen synthase GlgA [Candidatus Omnitrophota bacterium]
MKVVFAASEIAPFAKTGGLADVTGALPLEIRNLGHEVYAFLPRYRSIDIQKEGLKIVYERVPVPMGSNIEHARLFEKKPSPGLVYYFIDAPELFGREGLYGTLQGDYGDNDRRFTFFQRAVLEALKMLYLKPDIIHCHDWQTGLIPVYLKTLYAEEYLFKKTRAVFTVHNLAYQGNFPPDSLPVTGLSWNEYKFEKLEFYGKCSFIKGGIVYSDAVTTVSAGYAEEVLKEETGCGMHGALRQKGPHFQGILNGIDHRLWNPETDAALIERYSAGNLGGKKANKRSLRKENGLSAGEDLPLFGIVSRLVDQKGLDILIAIFDELMRLDLEIVILGLGDEKYHWRLRELRKKYRDRCGVHIVFDESMARRMYAGCDVMMIPSNYEPCGLTQMIALRYGTVPLVRAVGGLRDTVEEFHAAKGTGNGFLFEAYSGDAMLAAIHRALNTYREPTLWQKLVKNTFASDFSWQASAKKYVALYDKLTREYQKV